MLCSKKKISSWFEDAPITPIKIFVLKKLFSLIESNPEMIVRCLSSSAVFTGSLKIQCAGDYRPEITKGENSTV